MRAVVQRVKQAAVTVDNSVVGKIGPGLLVLLGVHKNDVPEDTEWMVEKILNLRIFRDDNDKMNLSLKDAQGEVLVVSQFTLYGNCANGRRPDFFDSAPPTIAIPIYEKFIKEVEKELGKVQAGVFGAYMQVDLTNDGPVTLIVENQSSRK